MVDCGGNGDCLYRVLAQFKYGDKERFRDIRMELSNYLVNHMDAVQADYDIGLSECGDLLANLLTSGTANLDRTMVVVAGWACTAQAHVRVHRACVGDVGQEVFPVDAVNAGFPVIWNLGHVGDGSEFSHWVQLSADGKFGAENATGPVALSSALSHPPSSSPSSSLSSLGPSPPPSFISDCSVFLTQ